MASAGRTLKILDSNSLMLEKQVGVGVGWGVASQVTAQVTSSQGESNIRTQDSPTSSRELGWSLNARSLRALAPLTFSQDLVSYGLPTFLVSSQQFPASTPEGLLNPQS